MSFKNTISKTTALTLLCSSLLTTAVVSANTLTNMQGNIDQTLTTLKNEQTSIEGQVKSIKKDLDTLKATYDAKALALVSTTKVIVELENKESNINKVKLADAQNTFNRIKADMAQLGKEQELKRHDLETIQKSLDGKKKEVDSAATTVGEYYAQVNGTDTFSSKLLDHAFKYYAKGIVYTQGGSRGSVSWNNERTDVTGGYLDCSSFVLMVMKEVGINVNPLGNTETMFGYKGTVFQEISRDQVTTGDVFVVGTPGASLGNGGHTGIFLDHDTIIHASVQYADNGGNGNIYLQDYPAYNFGLEPHFYRIIR